jgi:hypothetical protein
MPRNVATPQQSAQVQKEVGVGSGFGEASGIRVGNEIGSNRVAGVRPLRKSDRRLLESGEPSIYIYNVSPIFQWNANSGGRSFGAILKRGPLPAKLSVPLVIPGAIVRDYDAGNRFRNTYTEMGIDIAEDILQCSKEMPGLPQNDLTGYGCFYLIGKSFEELPEPEREKIYSEARAKHEEKCRLRVLEGDQLADSEVTRRWITDVYRLCGIFLAEECGDKTMYDRRWISKRGKSTPVAECPFCGYEHKSGLARCPNCKEILDQELYDSLKNRAAKTKGRPAEQTA